MVRMIIYVISVRFICPSFFYGASAAKNVFPKEFAAGTGIV